MATEGMRNDMKKCDRAKKRGEKITGQNTRGRKLMGKRVKTGKIEHRRQNMK